MSLQSRLPVVEGRRSHGRLPGWASTVVLLLLVVSMALGSIQVSGPTATVATTPTVAGSHSLSAVSPPPLPSPDRSLSASPRQAPVLSNPLTTSLVPSGSVVNSTGRGVFFTNQQLANPTPGNQTCANIYVYYNGVCTNTTNSPVIVHTSNGYYATAYNAMTNQTGCPTTRPYTTSEIGVSVSKGSPNSWSTPTYLVDSTCSNSTHANDYPSAWSPTMVALPNGTLALAYIEYNWSVGNRTSPTCYDVFPELQTLQCLTYDRLVFAESFDNGTTWTSPQVINQSAPNLNGNSTGMQDPQAPNLAVFGNTLYLAWENLTSPDYYFISSQIHLVVSTNGGRSWGSMINLPVQPGTYYGTPTSGATAANLLVSPSGELFLAYITNYTTSQFCQGLSCTTVFTVSVMLARSTNNGSMFHYSRIQVVPANDLIGYWYPLVATAPKLAYSPSTQQIYAVYSGGIFGTYCYYYASPPYCYADETPNTLWLSHSSNNGSSWATPKLVFPGITDSSYSAESAIYNPSIAVSPSGELYIQASYLNETQCFTLFGYSGYCGETVQLFTTSTNNGTSFGNPYYVSPGLARLSPDMCDGFQSSMVMVNSTPTLAWSQNSCPVWNITGGCFWPYSYGNTHIEISQLFNGTGATLTFQEAHLTAGLNWSVDVLGNARQGSAGTRLVISGVPLNQSYPFTLPWVNQSYGVADQPTASPASPVNVSSNSTKVLVDFGEAYLVQVYTTPPPIVGFLGTVFNCPYSLNNYECTNYLVSPDNGSIWMPANSSMAYSITSNNAVMPTCYECLNLSFQSWSGTGAGSFTTTNPNGSTIVRGPINESANFQLLNICDYGVCTPINYTYNFTESGLPNGTLWAVSINGNVSYSNLTYLDYNGSAGPLNYTAWAVYYNQTDSYIPTSSPSSPLNILTGSIINIRYRLQPTAGRTVNLTFQSAGLPAGTSWSVGFGGGSSGYDLSTSSTLSVSVVAGTYLLNSSIIYTQTGVAYVPVSFHIATHETELLNANYTKGPVPADLTFSISSTVVIVYTREYQVSASAGPGGSVSPTLLWASLGQTVNLTATPSAGYEFVDWSGNGAGAITSTNASISLVVRGVVSETATFRLIVPTLTVTVTALGLPSGISLTVQLGSQTYSGPSPLTIANLLNGSYAFSTPTVYSPTLTGTRYLVSAVSTLYGMTPSGLVISSSGNISLTYTTQYLVQVGSVINGSSQPSPGSYWNNSGTHLNLTALPNPGYYTLGWNGTYNSTGTVLSVTLHGPIYEVPNFAVYYPPAPATYTLTVSETGLPSGTSWGVVVGGMGLSTVSDSLTYNRLNGSYPLSVPTVSGGVGVRYVAGAATPPGVTVAQNASLTIQFVTQYLVTFQSSAGGNLTQATQWVPAGTTLSVSAVAQSGYRFINWTGQGAGNYTGTSSTANLTVNAPITELAAFVPTSSGGSGASSGTSSSSMAAISFGLLAVLLVVGLVVAFVIRRSQGSKPGGGAPKTSTTHAAPASPSSGAGSKPAGAPPATPSEPMTIYQGPGSKK